MDTRAFAVVLLVLAACGGPVVNAPVQVTGWITGEILDVHQAGIGQAAVEVSWTAPDGSTAKASAATQDDGFFAIGGVPQSSRYAVTVSKEGFVHLVTTVALPSVPIGAHPYENGAGFIGRIFLLHDTGTLQARVVDSTGRPAAGARAVLDISPGAFLDAMSAGYLATSTDVTASATADATGLLTFGGVIPQDELMLAVTYGLAFASKISVDPYDANADGVPDSAGATFSFDMSGTMFPGSIPLLALPRVGASTAFVLRSAPMDSLSGGSLLPAYNVVGPSESLILTFSHAVQPQSVVVQLADENVTAVVPATFAVSQNVVTIQPTAPLRIGAEYNLHVRAASADDGTVRDYVGFFFVESGSPPATSVQKISFKDTGDGYGGPPNGQLDPGEEVEISFNAVVAYFGGLSTLSPPQIVYANADVNGSGIIGDAMGEVGYSGSGYALLTNEPMAEPGRLFNPRRSGYTSRWTFAFTGPMRIAAGTRVQFEPGRLDPSMGLTTLWGAPIVATDGKFLEVAP